MLTLQKLQIHLNEEKKMKYKKAGQRAREICIFKNKDKQNKLYCKCVSVTFVIVHID